MPKKRKKWPIIAAICIGAGALLVWGAQSLVSSMNRNLARAGIQQAEVVPASIDATVVGTGTLAFAETEDIRIPAGVDVTAVFFDAGQDVSEGDLLAAVDTDACEALMSETYSRIRDLDAQMIETSSEQELVEVAAPAAGRISSVAAGAGSSVLRTLQENGYVVQIAEDGRMGVTVETDDLPAAESTVRFLFPDGTERSATVDTLYADAFRAVLTDASISAGTPVEILSPSGTSYGKGTLDPVDALSVVGPPGTVESLRVESGQTVEKGAVLFSVRASAPPAAYQELELERQTLAETYDQLADICARGGVVSPFSGTIISCNLTPGESTSNVPSADDISYAGFSPQEALSAFGISMSPRANPLREAQQPPEEVPAPGAPPDSSEPEMPDPDPEPAETGGPSEEPSSPPSPTASPAPALAPVTQMDVPLIPPITGLPLQTEISAQPFYAGSIRWTPDDTQAQAGTEYTASVRIEMAPGLTFAPDCVPRVLNGEVTGVSVSEDGTVLSFAAAYPATGQGFDLSNIDWSVLQSVFGGGLDLSGLGSLLSSGVISPSDLGFDVSSLLGSGLGGLDAGALYSAAGLDPSALYQSALGSALPDGASPYGASGNTESGVIAYTLAPADTMQLLIDVNQMDVLSVEPGMSCVVTVDALEGEEFPGLVSEIANTAASGTSYTATVLVDRSDGMRSGMTASAVITTLETESTMTLPVGALQEDGNRVFVYTRVDESNGELSGETDVETGVSNGTQVEILSGLEPGMTVYYAGEDPAEQFRRMFGPQADENAVSVSAETSGAGA